MYLNSVLDVTNMGFFRNKNYPLWLFAVFAFRGGGIEYYEKKEQNKNQEMTILSIPFSLS